MIRNYIFLGAPGVGKGTLAKKIAEKDGFFHISTGDLFRKNIQDNTSMGQKVKSILEAGDYVPDDVTNEMLKQALEAVMEKSVILDGYPRTIDQAEFLESINFNLTAAVSLETDETVIQSRLENRAKMENREDDTPEVIATRIKVYHQKTAPLIDFYKNKNQLISVDVAGSIEENYIVFKKEVLND